MTGRFTAVASLTLTAWSLLGCYAYIPVSAAPSVPVAGNVRITLSPAGTESLQQALGRNVREIEGFVVRSTTDSLAIAVEQTLTSTRERFVSTGDTVVVPVAAAERIQLRQVSRKRSVLLGLGIVATIALALAGIALGSSGASGPGQPGQPQP